MFNLFTTMSIKIFFVSWKHSLSRFQNSIFKLGKLDTVFWKLYLENISQTINSNVWPTILWIEKQKNYIKYFYQTAPNI